MSNELKYSYFFDKKQNKEIRFEEFLNYVNQNNQKLGIYEGNIYCPYCKVAKLSFVRESSQKVAYLRTTPGEKHEENCIYNYDLIDIPTFTTYFENLSYHAAQDKLNSIMNELFKEKVSDVSSIFSEAKKKLNSEFIPIKLEQSKREIKYLRRKKLTSIKKADVNPNVEELYAFYDKKVKLKIVEKISKKSNQPYHNLHIKLFNKKSNIWVTCFTVYLGQNKGIFVDIDAIYSIVLIGYLKLWNENLQIELKPNNALLFKLAE